MPFLGVEVEAMNEDLELIAFSDLKITYLCVLCELKEARMIDRWLESQSLVYNITEIAHVGYVLKGDRLAQ